MGKRGSPHDRNDFQQVWAVPPTGLYGLHGCIVEMLSAAGKAELVFPRRHVRPRPMLKSRFRNYWAVPDSPHHLFVYRQSLGEIAQLMVREAELHQRSDISATQEQTMIGQSTFGVIITQIYVAACHQSCADNLNDTAGSLPGGTCPKIHQATRKVSSPARYHPARQSNLRKLEQGLLYVASGICAGCQLVASPNPYTLSRWFSR